MRKKVLILSEAVGHGHTKAAEALLQGISLLLPMVEVKILEASHLLHPIATKIMVQFYLKLIVFFPNIWRKIYHYYQDRPLSKWKKEIIYFFLYRKIEDTLSQEKPHVVICTHSFSSVAMARLKRRGFPVTLCVAITDFHVHGVWVHPEVDLYLVANQNVYDELIRMGIHQNKILVTGIPSRSDFWSTGDKEAIRKKFKLKDLPIILIMGGGLGLGGIQKISYALLKWKSKVQLIICTGDNTKLRKILENDPAFHHPHIHILGFVEEIGDWMEVADLLITKSGGLTCFEALLKGVPLCIYQPISGHEEKNCDFLVKNRLAVRIDDSVQIDQWIEKMCKGSDALSEIDQNISRFKSQIDPLACAKSIVNLLHQRQVERAAVQTIRFLKNKQGSRVYVDS